MATEESSIEENVEQATVHKIMKEWPVYTMSETASVEERRAMVVKAMDNLENIQWTPDRRFTYRKTGSGDKYNFEFIPSKVYSGIPYTNGDAGIFQWVSAMNMEKGILDKADFENINFTQGATCSTTVCWACMPVSNSVKAPWLTYYLVPKNGFVPVGNMKYPEGLESYKDYPTDRIVEDNGTEGMLEAYAACLPADALVSTGSPKTDNHTVMVIEAPTVVRKEDGTIDAEKSTITIRDQRFVERAEQVDGHTVYYHGRDKAELTFKYILNLNFIPVMLLDFRDNNPYVKAEAKLSAACETLAELADATVQSNYCVCILYGRVISKNGAVLYEEKKTTVGREIRIGEAFDYPVKNVLTETLTDFAKKTADARVQIEAVLATGERFNLAEVSVK